MLRRRTAPLHHPRPGIYNAVLRSDRFGTGHRLGIQNAPAGGPLQITDHYTHNRFYTALSLYVASTEAIAAFAVALALSAMGS